MIEGGRNTRGSSCEEELLLLFGIIDEARRRLTFHAESVLLVILLALEYLIDPHVLMSVKRTHKLFISLFC